MSVKSVRDFEKGTKTIGALQAYHQAFVKATAGLTLAELEGLTPELLRAAGPMRDALRECFVNLEILHRAGNLPKSALHLKVEQALANADKKGG